ncbi:MAG: BatD family protein, partial [Myxococcota bacterium]
MVARVTTSLFLVAALVGAPTFATASDAGDEANSEPTDGGAEQSAPFEASLTQSFSAPETPRVGDDLELELEVEHPKNATVTLPDGFGTVRWELENTQRSTTATQSEAAKTSLDLTFQVFRAGSTTLPSFDVTVLDEQGRAVTLQTEPVEAKIISVLDAEEEAKLLPPRPTVAVWVEDYTLAWVGGALGAAALAALVVFLVMRRREEDAYVEPARPAHVVALEKLSSLSPGDLLERGQYMIFYVRMSEAVREYLGRRYGFRGTELTTTEILDHLEEVDWPDSLAYEDVRDWMQHCDLIKFSGMVPSKQDADDA